MLAGRTTDKVVFGVIYIAVALLVLWGGRRMVNYALDARFFRDYLLQWETLMTELQYQTFEWPPYSEGDPVGYMQTLIQRMAAAGLKVPESNTAKGFIYRIGKLGHEPQQILLVCRAEGIRVYGLAPSTFQRLDRFIDGRSDPHSGRFTGQLSMDQISYIGKWKI